MFQKNKLLTTLLLLAATVNGYAQPSKQDSLHSLQDERVLTVYQHTANPATLVQRIYPQYGFASASAGTTTGDFRRPMEAQSSTFVSAQTGGYRQLKNWTYQGFFQYKKTYDNNIAWSGVRDAYEGNPFLWADSSTGNWDRDEVKTAIALVAPTIFKKFRASLNIDYTIGSGARKRDPKPFYRYRDIALQPGITFQLSTTTQVGITGTAGFAKEEAELGFYSNSGNVLLYRLRGFGTFTKTPFVSGERKRVETRWRGSAHFQKVWKRHQLLLTGFAQQRDDEVTEGVAAPITTGYFTGIQYGGEAMLYNGDADKGTSVSVHASSHDGYADDVIFRAGSASFSRQEAGANVSIWNGRKSASSGWQASFLPSLQYINYTDQGTRTQWDVTRLSLVARHRYRQQVKPQLHLYVSPELSYVFPIDNYYTNSVENTIVKALVQPDYWYFNTTYKEATITAGVEFGSGNSPLLHSISLVSRNRFVSERTIYKNRNYFNLTYAIIF